MTNDPDPRIVPGSFKGNVLVCDAPGGKSKLAVVLSWTSPNASDAAAVKAANTRFYTETVENIRKMFHR